MGFKKIINLSLDFCLYLIVGFVPIFSLPLFLNSHDFPKLVAFSFLTFLGLILLLLKKIFSPKITLKIYRQDLLVFLFLLIYLLATLAAINPLTALIGLYDSWVTSFLIFFSGFIFYLLLNEQITHPQKAKELLVFIVAGGLIACLSALWQYIELGGSFLLLQEIIRVSGSLGQPNYLGFYLSLVLPLSLGLVLLIKPLWLKIILGLATFLISLILILTASRAAWLALALAALIFFFLFLFKIPKTKFLKQLKRHQALIISSSLILIFSFLLLSRPLTMRIKESFQATPEQNTLLIRGYEWLGGIRVFQEKPLLGVGPENLYYRYEKYKEPWLNLIEEEWFYKTYSIRNIYIDLLAKTGILGLASFLGLVIYIFIKLIQLIRSPINTLLVFLFFSFLVFLFFGLFYFFTPSSLILFWVLLALIRTLTRESQKSFAFNLPVKKKPLFKIMTFIPLFLIFIFLIILFRALVADFYIKKGDLARAEQRTGHLEKGVSLNPFYSDDKRMLAGAYIEMAIESIDRGTSKINLRQGGEIFAQKALEIGHSTVATDPYDPVNYDNLSYRYFRLSSQNREFLQSALFYAEKAKEIEKQSPKAWDHAGLILLDMGNLEKAKEYFEKAIELKPDFNRSHFHLGETLRQMGDPEKALPHYQMFPGELAEQEIKETLLEIKRKSQ